MVQVTLDKLEQSFFNSTKQPFFMSPNKNGVLCPKCKTETPDLFSVEDGTDKILCRVCRTQKALQFKVAQV